VIGVVFVVRMRVTVWRCIALVVVVCLCLFFLMTCCTSGFFSVVDLLLFLFRVCLNGGCGLTGGNARWNCAVGE